VVLALYLLTGAVACAAMSHLWHWRGLRTERLHFWAGVWCADTILFLVGRIVTLSAGDPAGDGANAARATFEYLNGE
jgi:hypothetical protein